MADTLNDFAISRLAQYILGVAPPDTTPELRLFVNDVVVDNETVPGDLTECTATGYAAVTLVPGSWTIPAPVAGVVEAFYGAVDFVMTAGLGQTIYGHYVVDTTANNILWAQTWTTPFVIPVAGGTVKVFPFYTSEQCSG